MQECANLDWSSWVAVDEDQKDRLELQLHKEIGAAHYLYEGLSGLRVTARDTASDDVLVRDQSKPDVAYVVHLTWGDAASNAAAQPWTCFLPMLAVPQSLA